MKFEAEGRENVKKLRSLLQCNETVKGQSNYFLQLNINFNLLLEVLFRSDTFKVPIGTINWDEETYRNK